MVTSQSQVVGDWDQKNDISTGLKGVIAGATGACGRLLVAELLMSDRWDQVQTIGRRKVTFLCFFVRVVFRLSLLACHFFASFFLLFLLARWLSGCVAMALWLACWGALVFPGCV